MKKYERMTLKKNAAQAAKGRRRAMLACRDAEGRFVKIIQPDDQPESGHIIITTTTIQDLRDETRKETEMKTEETAEMKAEEKAEVKAEEKTEVRRPFERFVDRAMEDAYWKELIQMRTGLPKNYFANFSRKGTFTHKAVLEELQQQVKAQGKGENPYRYEEVDPRTGERAYCGIPIPRDAPPRPDRNAVWNRNDGRWER